MQGGTPTISGNTITASYAGIYYEGGGGTASGNTIGFSGGGAGRFGIYVLGQRDADPRAATRFSTTRRERHRHQRGGDGAGVQIVNNTVNVSGGDYALEIVAGAVPSGLAGEREQLPDGAGGRSGADGAGGGDGDGGAADAGSGYDGEHVRGAESVGAGGGDADDRGGDHADGRTARAACR